MAEEPWLLVASRTEWKNLLLKTLYMSVAEFGEIKLGLGPKCPFPRELALIVPEVATRDTGED